MFFYVSLCKRGVPPKFSESLTTVLILFQLQSRLYPQEQRPKTN